MLTLRGAGSTPAEEVCLDDTCIHLLGDLDVRVKIALFSEHKEFHPVTVAQRAVAAEGQFVRQERSPIVPPFISSRPLESSGLLGLARVAQVCTWVSWELPPKFVA